MHTYIYARMAVDADTERTHRSLFLILQTNRGTKEHAENMKTYSDINSRLRIQFTMCIDRIK